MKKIQLFLYFTAAGRLIRKSELYGIKNKSEKSLWKLRVKCLRGEI